VRVLNIEESESEVLCTDSTALMHIVSLAILCQDLCEFL
jgi:hypothetical protein